jgi:hypothetical protein
MSDWQPIGTVPKPNDPDSRIVVQVWLPKKRLGSHIWPMRISTQIVTIGERFAFDCASNMPTHWRWPPDAPPGMQTED